MMRPRRRATARSVIVAAALALAACVLTALTPPSWRSVDPFVSAGAADATVRGSDVIVRVDEVVLASAVITNDERLEGTWVAARVTAAATVTEVQTTLYLVRAHIGERIFHAAAHVPDTILRERLRVGAGTTGWVVFEVPPDVTVDAVNLQFLTDAITGLSDTVVAIEVGDIARVPEVDITRPELVDAP